jgi:hypothetical protein
MKTYVCHAARFDYRQELYEPLKRSVLGREHELILPHEGDDFQYSKPIIESADIVLAEVSYPSTGLGIELGWAHAAGKTIYLIHRLGAIPSASLSVLKAMTIIYKDATELTTLIDAQFGDKS